MNSDTAKGSEEHLQPGRKRASHFLPLDALRGVAALGVVAFHMRYGVVVQDQASCIYWLSKSGYLGVAMFFVISGFCLGASAVASQQREESPARFLYRRMRRIYPPLWCSILVVISMPWLKYGAFQLIRRSAEWPQPLFADFELIDWLGTASLLQVFRFPEMPVDDKFDRINVVYWSLAIEVQFYVVMALLLKLKNWYYPGLLLITTISALAVWCPGLEWLRLNTGFFLSYWPMFATGILVFELRRRDVTLCKLMSDQKALLMSKMLFLGLTSLVIIWLSSGRRCSPELFAAVTGIGLWLLILWEDEIVSRSQNQSSIWGTLFRPLSFLGLISYSIYLIHFNLYKIPELILGQRMLEGSVVLQLSVTILVCLLCYPFYLLCEKPFLPKSKSPKIS